MTHNIICFQLPLSKDLSRNKNARSMKNNPGIIPYANARKKNCGKNKNEKIAAFLK